MNFDIQDMDVLTLEDWMTKHYDTIFRYWVYRRMFTPYEQDKKFTDESMYEDSYASTGYIREIIRLPDGDLLIGFLYPDEEFEHVDYYKLSEIRLGLNPIDEDQWGNDLKDKWEEDWGESNV